MRDRSPAVAMFFGLRACGRAALTALLCVVLVEQPLVAEAPVAVDKGKPVAVGAGQIPQDERVLHALNRLTFGPRPGDVAAVSAMGLNKWFDLQLNPNRIDDGKLDAMLQQYPGYFLSFEQMEEKFPSPATLKLMESGRIPLPSDPAQRAIAMDQVAFYRIYKAKQAKGAAAATGAKDVAGGKDGDGDGAGGMQGEAPQMPSRKGRRQAAAPADAEVGTAGDMEDGGGKMDDGKAMAADADPVSRLRFCAEQLSERQGEGDYGACPGGAVPGGAGARADGCDPV